MSRRILSIGSIINRPADYDTRFYSGAGVQMGGANTISVRRALRRRAGRKEAAPVAALFTTSDRADLEVEYIANVNASSTQWLPTYYSSNNSNYGMSDTNNSAGVNSSRWSHSSTNGYTQLTDYGMIVHAYTNDGIMGSLDSTSGQALSYEIWIKGTGGGGQSWPATADNPKGWLLSYETGWGPAITLNDSRINGGGVGVTPGSDVNQGVATGYYASSTFTSKFGSSGTLSQSKNGWDHIIGYWNNSNGVCDRGTYINGYKVQQDNRFPNFDNTARQLALGNYYSGSINNATHDTRGISVYSVRVWHKKIDQTLATKLYEAGHD